MKIVTLTIVGLSLALPAAYAEDPPNFETDIYPFIENSCVECHKAPYEDERGRVRRPKADLRFDGKEFILQGGENNDDFPTLTPGDPDKSAMYTLVILPLSDDDHMPPEDKADELTDEQKELLKKWIAAGADFGDWTGKTE
ncbi:MAG: c-type cytochrome domain-containing protein [Verrucomicrobiota bacterium]